MIFCVTCAIDFLVVRILKLNNSAEVQSRNDHGGNRKPIMLYSITSRAWSSFEASNRHLIEGYGNRRVLLPRTYLICNLVYGLFSNTVNYNPSGNWNDPTDLLDSYLDAVWRFATGCHL